MSDFEAESKGIPGILFNGAVSSRFTESARNSGEGLGRGKTVLIETTGDLEELLDAIDKCLAGEMKVTVCRPDQGARRHRESRGEGSRPLFGRY